MVRRGSVVLTVLALVSSGLLAVAAPATALPTDSPAATDLPGGTYVRVAPTRVLDTRSGLGAPAGATTRTTLAVAGSAGVPTTGVAAVVLNVTVTEPGDAGWLAVSPDGTRATSNLNFVRAQTVAQLATSTLDGDGRVVLTSSTLTHVVADVVGWFTDSATAASGATYSPTTPRRLFDSRVAGSGGQMVGGATRRIALTGVPAGATAVAVNLTSVTPSEQVFVAAWGSGAWPGTSSMNVAAGDIRSNRAIVPVAADGTIQVLVNLGRSDLVVDLSGWFTADATGSRFVPLDPARIGDSRAGGVGRIGGYPYYGDLHIAGIRLPGTSVVLPPLDALVRPTAAWLSVTVVSPTWAGWLAVSPAAPPGQPHPSFGTSDINFGPGVTPNAVLAGLGDAGDVSTTSQLDDREDYAGRLDVVVDLAGIFVQASASAPGLAQQGPTDYFNQDREWDHHVPGNWGDVVELAGNGDVAVLRRDGTVVTQNGNGVVTLLATDAAHIAANGGGVFVVKRDGTVWTNSERRGADGVDHAVTGFRPVTGATDVVAVKPLYSSTALVARRTDGSIITWGAESAPTVRTLTWTGTGNLDMSFDSGTNCIVHADGSVEVVDSGRSGARTAPIGARTVVSEQGWPVSCLALDTGGRVHRLSLGSGAVTDAVLDGPAATALVTGQTVTTTFGGQWALQARVLTSGGSVYDLVVKPDAATVTWLPVPGLNGATVVGGGYSLVTWVPPTN